MRLRTNCFLENRWRTSSHIEHDLEHEKEHEVERAKETKSVNICTKDSVRFAAEFAAQRNQASFDELFSEIGARGIPRNVERTRKRN